MDANTRWEEWERLPEWLRWLVHMDANTRWEEWERLPEWLRWLLLFPVLFILSALWNRLLPVLFKLLAGLQPSWRWYQFFWNYILSPSVGITMLAYLDSRLLLIFALRGHKILGWLWYLFLSLLFSILGLITLLSVPDVVGWDDTDWRNLCGSIAWFFAGTIAFRSYLKASASLKTTKSKDAAAVAATGS